MVSSKPTILLVHGAWHGPAHYAPLTTALEEKGYTCVTPTLPSGDTPPPEDPPVADVHCIRSIAEGLIDSGRDVVAIAHSYGGIVASEAFAGLGCRARSAEGKGGGVRMLVYVAGFMTTGEETIEALLLLHQDSDWALSKIDPVTFSPGPEFGPVFYSDLPEEQHARWLAMLRPGPRACARYAPRRKAYVDVDSAYVYCTQDLAVPLYVQEELVGLVKGLGVEVKEVRLESGHFPSLSMPGRLAEVVDELARESGGLNLGPAGSKA